MRVGNDVIQKSRDWYKKSSVAIFYTLILWDKATIVYWNNKYSFRYFYGYTAGAFVNQGNDNYNNHVFAPNSLLAIQNTLNVLFERWGLFK